MAIASKIRSYHSAACIADRFSDHQSYASIHLGEIAYRTKTVLEFDTEKEAITNSEKAASMLTKDYREPFGLPKSV